MNVSKPITSGAGKGDIMQGNNYQPYKMKNQLAVGKIGESVCINFLTWCCSQQKWGFSSFEDVRHIKKYQDEDVDFLIHKTDGTVISLEAKTDTYGHETGNIFVEILVAGFALTEEGQLIPERPGGPKSITQTEGWAFRDAHYIFYYFTGNKKFYIFERTYASYYTIISACSESTEKKPIFRTARNDKDWNDGKIHYGIGACVNVQQMFTSKTMKNHIWEYQSHKGPFYNPKTGSYDQPQNSS